MNRTEEQKIYQDGITVILGGRDYIVRPLKLREEREWRQKLAATMATLPAFAKATSADPDSFAVALETLMVNIPDQVIDLFFSYAKELDRELIEEEATGHEVAEGFKQVVVISFPLAQALGEAMTAISR